MRAPYLFPLVGLLLLALPGRAQQIVCERLLTTPGMEVSWPTACTAPNGEFLITGAAQPIGTITPTWATHTFLARLRANGCDTLWTRRLPHAVANYSLSAVLADARGIWLLTQDTITTAMATAPYKGVRLWRLTADGRVRRVAQPVAPWAGEGPVNLLAAANGGVFVQLQNEFRAGFLSPGVLRFDSTLALRWRRDYGRAGNSRAVSLCYTPTGKLLFTGMIGVGSNYDSHARVMEIDPAQGDSLRGVLLPWGPNVTEEYAIRNNSQPQDAIALTSGGYALLSRVDTTPHLSDYPGQLSRVDNNYNVVWRYRMPPYTSPSDFRSFKQVRELADGTLVALVQTEYPTRTFWLYRFSATTGALLGTYPFTSAFSAFQMSTTHLLPVASDSTLLVVGRSWFYNSNRTGGIYVARLRVPGLPRVVAPALPLATRGEAVASLAFSLYPNPAHDAVTVNLPAAASGQLELRDALGRVVRKQGVGAGSPPVRWSLAGLAPGLYAVVLSGPAGAAVRRLVVE